MTHVNSSSSEKPLFRIGLNQNYYVYCQLKEPLIEIVKEIGKSENSIYYRPDHEVWVIRIKLKSHKEKVKKIFERSN